MRVDPEFADRLNKMKFEIQEDYEDEAYVEPSAQSSDNDSFKDCKSEESLE